MFSTKIFYMFLALIFLAASMAIAQDLQQDDPYKKPQIWKKIKANPNDSTLWSLYVGKKWALMSADDKEAITSWQQELYIQSIAEKEAVYGARDNEDLFKEPTKAGSSVTATAKVVRSEAAMKQLVALEAIIMQERSDITQLKKNIFENFVILEDVLREEFALYNVSYRYYDDVHSDRKYSEIKWIEEQEARLKKLKQEKVAALRKEVGIK
ncbi:MAG: hypothetical protein EAZ08_08410 [Cytophagales bacterium]|nr:MAG: hypothetical protein EAZ08_08410 [Cytophagales bacterium]